MFVFSYIRVTRHEMLVTLFVWMEVLIYNLSERSHENMNINYKKAVFIGIIFEMILLVIMFFVYASIISTSSNMPPLAWLYCSLYLIPLIWMIPMAIKIYNSYMYGYPMSNTFKAAVVICCGLWPYVFLFFDK